MAKKELEAESEKNSTQEPTPYKLPAFFKVKDEDSERVKHQKELAEQLLSFYVKMENVSADNIRKLEEEQRKLIKEQQQKEAAEVAAASAKKDKKDSKKGLENEEIKKIKKDSKILDSSEHDSHQVKSMKNVASGMMSVMSSLGDKLREEDEPKKKEPKKKESKEKEPSVDKNSKENKEQSEPSTKAESPKAGSNFMPQPLSVDSVSTVQTKDPVLKHYDELAKSYNQSQQPQTQPIPDNDLTQDKDNDYQFKP